MSPGRHPGPARIEQDPENRGVRGRAEFKSFDVEIHRGRFETCRYGARGAHDRSFVCHPFEEERVEAGKRYDAKARACYDVKSDGKEGMCTAWAHLDVIG